jgi:hypothetical protein
MPLCTSTIVLQKEKNVKFGWLENPGRGKKKAGGYGEYETDYA